MSSLFLSTKGTWNKLITDNFLYCCGTLDLKLLDRRYWSQSIHTELVTILCFVYTVYHLLMIVVFIVVFYYHYYWLLLLLSGKSFRGIKISATNIIVTKHNHLMTKAFKFFLLKKKVFKIWMVLSCQLWRQCQWKYKQCNS